MILDEVLEQAAYARPGFSLVSFKEAALPLYQLTTRLLTLEKKTLGPIEEACLGAVNAGLSAPEDVSSFLGLTSQVLNGVLAGLNTNECINYSRAKENSKALMSLTDKGRRTLETLRETAPQESVVKLIFDPFERKVCFIPTSALLKPRDIKELGWYEVPLCGAKRPEVEDVSLGDIDRVLQQLPRRGEGTTRELLALRRIERREMHFLPCVLLFYRSVKTNEVQVAFYLDNGFSLPHEYAFRELGGPEQAGANHVLGPPEFPQIEDLLQGINGEEKLRELITLEQDVSAEIEVKPDTKIVPNEPGTPLKTPQEPHPQEGKALSRLRSMTQRYVRCHEHPGLLRKALTSTENRLLIISPWITHQVVDRNFMYSLEALLRNGIKVTIGYGLADEAGGGGGNDKAKQKPSITSKAEGELRDIQKRFDNFSLVFLGNTHRKLLVSDDRFAVVTSFNWLSFRGDPNKKARDEFGFLVTEPGDVDGIYMDGMDLLRKGYTHPDGLHGKGRTGASLAK